MNRRGVILISGMVAGDPSQGGATWAVLQYVLGLQRLGYEVVLVEPLRTALPPPAVAAYFDDVIAAFDLAGRAALLCDGGAHAHGMTIQALRDAAQRADLLINISGMLTHEPFASAPPIRLYLDLDPGFVQLWHATQGIDMRFAGHTHFATVGQALGTPGCDVPTCGIDWIKTWPPVVLERWPPARPCPDGPLTTIGHWRGYGSIEHQGVFYGQKAHSFRAFFELPARTRQRVRPALAIHPGETADRDALARHGWTWDDPQAVAGTPARYQDFIRASKAELGIAKSGYVQSRCGWFSDRSVCYLASARPVIAQETGFSRVLPTGEGLFTFRTLDDILAALEAIDADPQRHADRARALAEEYFDSDIVLPRLLERVGLS